MTTKDIMKMEIADTDHVSGAKNASVVLIEYADYQCPYCGQAYQVLKEIQKEMGNDMMLVFRNFPIPQLHPYAIHAAIAAEVAASQGKFWEMHDMLFENQRNLTDKDLIKYAKELNLDVPKFEEDLKKDRFFQKVKDDYESGIEKGVNGTPAFFVNGKIYNGNWMEMDFLNYLKSKVK